MLDTLIETHPYSSFLPDKAKMLILGSFPPYRFTVKNGIPRNLIDEIDFYYGSKYNYLWPIMSELSNSQLQDIESIRAFLTFNDIGISDIVEKSSRALTKNGTPSALDKDLRIKEFRNLSKILTHSTLEHVVCTSEFVHKYLLKIYHIPNFLKVSIIPSPSRSANRTIGRIEEYKKLKNSNFNTIDYRKLKYSEHFKFD